MNTYSGSLTSSVKVSARLSIVTPARNSLLEVADDQSLAAEGQAVAVDGPQHADQREHDHHLHQHRQHVLAAHQAAVEQRQAGQGHEDDEQRGRHHPGHVALVHRRRRQRPASAAAAAGRPRPGGHGLGGHRRRRRGVLRQHAAQQPRAARPRASIRISFLHDRCL
jgi:hypothetical protein